MTENLPKLYLFPEIVMRRTRISILVVNILLVQDKQCPKSQSFPYSQIRINLILRTKNSER